MTVTPVSRDTSTTLTSDTVEVTVDLPEPEPTPEPNITVTKRAYTINSDNTLTELTSIDPSQYIHNNSYLNFCYIIEVTNNSDVAYTINLEDTLPSGIIGITTTMSEKWSEWALIIPKIEGTKVVLSNNGNYCGLYNDASQSFTSFGEGTFKIDESTTYTANCGNPSLPKHTLTLTNYTIPANKTIKYLIPVCSIGASSLIGVMEPNTTSLKNTATVTINGDTSITKTATNEIPLEPTATVVTKTPVSLSVSGTTINYKDLSDVDGQYTSGDTTILEGDTFYYMIDIFNTNNTVQTYNLIDVCDSSGYMSDTNLVWTTSNIDEPTSANILKNGDNPPVSAIDAYGNILNCDTSLYYDSTATTATNVNLYTVLENTTSNGHETINATVTVNPYRHTYVFIPFKVNSGFVGTDNSYDSYYGTYYKAITPNTVTVTNKTQGTTEEPIEAKSEYVIVTKPTVTLTKSVLQYNSRTKNNDGTFSAATTSTDKNTIDKNSTGYFVDGDYVYYKIEINTNNELNDYSLVEFLPPYLVVDDDKDYAYSSGPNTYDSNFISNGILKNNKNNNSVKSSIGNQTPNYGDWFNPSNDSDVFLKNPTSSNADTYGAYYVMGYFSADKFYTNFYKYQYTSNGKKCDAVVINFENLPKDNTERGFTVYIRCKVVTNDSTRNFVLEDGQTEPLTNTVVAPDETTAKNKQVIVQPRKISLDKYVINPDKVEEFQNKINNTTITNSDIKKYVNEGYLLSIYSIDKTKEQTLYYLVALSSNVPLTGYTLTDVLPSISDYTWSDDNVQFLTNNSNNNSDFNLQNSTITSCLDSEQRVQFTLNGVPANTTPYVSILALTYPKDKLTETVYNTLTLASPRDTIIKSMVTHPVPTVTKNLYRVYSSNTEIASNICIGDTSTYRYEIQVEDSSIVDCSNVLVTEDLTKVKEYFDITDIDFGNISVTNSYTTDEGQTTSKAYTVRITMDDNTTYTNTVDGEKTLNLSGILPSGKTANDVAKIEWYLYPTDIQDTTFTVTAFSMGTPAKITCTQKSTNITTLTKETTVTNTVNLTTSDPNIKAEATTNTKLLPLTINKVAYDSNGETLTEDSKVELKDKVTFKITITNPNDTSVVLPINGLTLTDTISNAFDQDTKDVTITVMKNDKTNSNLLSGKTISFENGTAKIDFKTLSSVNINFKLNSGETIEISYTLPVSYDEVTATDDSENTNTTKATIKNSITSEIGSAETTTIPVSSQKQLDARLQKGIVSIDNSNEDLYHYNINANKETMQIVYNAVVFNDTSSNMNLPVEYLVDYLPEDFTFVSMIDGEQSKSYEQSPTDWKTSTTATAYTSPYTITANYYETTRQIVFTVANGDDTVSLAPNEYLTFSYVCNIDIPARCKYYLTSLTSTIKSTNTLYLACPKGDEIALTTTDTTFKNQYTKPNDGTCTIVESNSTMDKKLDTVISKDYDWLESDVTITPNGLILPTVSKEATLYKNGNSPKKFDSTKVLVQDSKSSIKWEITIDNTNEEYQTAISNYTITDTMPTGYQFVTDDISIYNEVERNTDGTIKYYDDNTTYTYGDMVFTLYDSDGTVVSTTKITNFTGDPYKRVLDLSSEEFNIPYGDKAVISYWGYYYANDLGVGEFINSATVDFNQAVAKTTTKSVTLDTTQTSIDTTATFYSYGGYSTSSVKQITDLSDSDKDTGNERTDEDNSGNGYGDGHANGYGNIDDNYVIAEKQGDEVGYSLHITNDSYSTIDRLVVIDKLPYPNDNGTNNQDSLRGSQFHVALDTSTEKAIVVEKTKGVNNINGTDSDVQTIDEDNYIVLYSSKTGYTATEWNSADITDEQFNEIKDGKLKTIGDWHTTYDSENDLTIRLIFRNDFTLEPSETIRVYFKGTISDDAQAGQIAWNSFGYKYRIQGKSVYTLAPEPAKVGVLIDSNESAQVVLKKVDDKSNPLSDVTFNIYSDEECKTLVSSITTDDNGEAVSIPLALGVYYIKEETPEGYVENTNVYEVSLKTDGAVYGLVGDEFTEIESLNDTTPIVNTPKPIETTTTTTTTTTIPITSKTTTTTTTTTTTEDTTTIDTTTPTETTTTIESTTTPDMTTTEVTTEGTTEEVTTYDSTTTTPEETTTTVTTPQDTTEPTTTTTVTTTPTTVKRTTTTTTTTTKITTPSITTTKATTQPTTTTTGTNTGSGGNNSFEDSNGVGVSTGSAITTVPEVGTTTKTPTRITDSMDTYTTAVSESPQVTTVPVETTIDTSESTTTVPAETTTMESTTITTTTTPTTTEDITTTTTVPTTVEDTTTTPLEVTSTVPNTTTTITTTSENTTTTPPTETTTITTITTTPVKTTSTVEDTTTPTTTLTTTVPNTTTPTTTTTTPTETTTITTTATTPVETTSTVEDTTIPTTTVTTPVTDTTTTTITITLPTETATITTTATTPVETTSTVEDTTTPTTTTVTTTTTPTETTTITTTTTTPMETTSTAESTTTTTEISTTAVTTTVPTTTKTTTTITTPTETTTTGTTTPVETTSTVESTTTTTVTTPVTDTTTTTTTTTITTTTPPTETTITTTKGTTLTTVSSEEENPPTGDSRNIVSIVSVAIALLLTYANTRRKH